MSRGRIVRPPAVPGPDYATVIRTVSHQVAPGFPTFEWHGRPLVLWHELGRAAFRLDHDFHRMRWVGEAFGPLPLPVPATARRSP
jgi:hypothetical protein